MIPLSCIEASLTDQSEGLRAVITWFLNLVMQHDAPSKPAPTVMSEHRLGLRIGMVLAIEHSSPGMAISSSPDRSSERDRLRPGSVDGTPGSRRPW